MIVLIRVYRVVLSGVALSVLTPSGFVFQHCISTALRNCDDMMIMIMMMPVTIMMVAIHG